MEKRMVPFGWYSAQSQPFPASGFVVSLYMTAYTSVRPFVIISLKMTEPSGNAPPAGNLPFCKKENAREFIRTRTNGWCAVEPFSVPLVTESAWGKSGYAVNGLVAVTNANNAASVERAAVGCSVAPLPYPCSSKQAEKGEQY
jgi:hypothetical protein